MGSNSVLPDNGPRQRVGINWSFQMEFTGLNVPQVLPPFFVPDGAIVRVRATNGTKVGNSDNVKVGQSRESALNGPNDSLPAWAEIVYPVKNTNTIWACGAIGDGVMVSVKGA